MRKPFVLRSAAIYDDKALMEGLGVAKLTLEKARCSGHLRSARMGHRMLYLGKWAKDWFEDRGKCDEDGAPDDPSLATPNQI